jgi:hypothetical protein
MFVQVQRNIIGVVRLASHRSRRRPECRERDLVVRSCLIAHCNAIFTSSRTLPAWLAAR